jgi:cation diffusion facilitator family transporter
MIVAVIGLLVNLASAWLLKEDHVHHHHGHDGHHAHGNDHEHDHHHHSHGGDNNLRAAYLHVMADALTSVLAIAALLLGGTFGWSWLDPAMGIVGALVIARWSLGLVRQSGAVLVDFVPKSESLPAEIREALHTSADVITDLHVWRLGPGHHGAVVSLRSSDPREPSHYRSKLAHIHELSHVTVEVERA